MKIEGNPTITVKKRPPCDALVGDERCTRPDGHHGDHIVELAVEPSGESEGIALPHAREHVAEDHIAAASVEASGSIAVATVLPGPPDEPVMREGFFCGPGAFERAVGGPSIAPQPGIILGGDHAAAYREFQSAAAELETAGLALQAAQRRYQTSIAKLSPLAARSKQ